MDNSKKATNFEQGTSSQCIEMKQSDKQHNKFFSPEQLLEMYPYAKEIGWTKKDVEFLADEKLVLKDPRSEQLMILSKSFEEILEHHRLQQKKEGKSA